MVTDPKPAAAVDLEALKRVAEAATHPICQSEDQGGHPGCHRPATFQSKDVVSFSHTAPLVRMYFCRFHRERFYRLEDTEPMPPTQALAEALESNADFERSELDRCATLHFEQDTASRARLERLLGLPKTNWWKRVIDAAETALAELEQLRAGAPKWIACTERMPELAGDDDGPGASEWVTVYAPARGPDMAFWDGNVWQWRADGYAIASEITHWMPLPVAPPEAVKP